LYPWWDSNPQSPV